MDLIGEKVKHKTFGFGIIEELNKEYIIVRFSPEKTARFKFPDVFAQGFLCAVNSTLAQYVFQILADRKCDICGEENVNTELVAGNRICHKCKVKHTAICSMCGNPYIKSSAQFISDSEYPHIKTQICKKCADNTSLRCRVCGHRYFEEYIAPQTTWMGELAFCKECEELVIKSTTYEKYYSDTSLTFRLSENDTLYVLLGNDECYHHNTSPAVIALELNTNEEIFVEGQYCNKCNQVQITRNTCAAYRRYHEAMKCTLVIKGLDDADYENTEDDVIYEYRERADESKLRILGYSVSQNESLSDVERQALLKNLISTNQVTKGYVVGQLKSLIRINGKKQTNIVARMKWERDLEFVLRL